MNEDYPIPANPACDSLAKCHEESMLERLHLRRNSTTQELHNLNEAITALEANPAVCDVIVKLSRVTDRLR